MPELVFIREIDPSTFLHFASRREGTCLRDYSRGPQVPPVENRGYGTSQIRDLLKHRGNLSEKAPEHAVSDSLYWHQRIFDRNVEYGLPGNVGPGKFARLLDQFHAEVGSLVTEEGQAALRTLIDRWTSHLAAIVEKPDSFNHWDRDDSSGLFTPTTGSGWASQMLEHCRHQGQVQLIRTGEPSLDFSLISMDLVLGISSMNNPVRAGIPDSIEPDGLGIRSDGTFCVVEIKAESDCPELFRATIQALCGALAVHAKRDMIVRLAREATGKRHAAASATLPADTPSLGLYILVDSKNFRVPEDAGFRDSLSLLMKAFPPVREVAFFSVDPRSPDFPATIRVSEVVR